MNGLDVDIIKKKLRLVDWKLLVFLLLVLNVKLVIKIIAIILITILERRSISLKGFLKQPYLFFYFGMIAIGIINLLLQYRYIQVPLFLVTALGVLLWLFPAIAAYHIFNMIQNRDLNRIHRTVTLFFLLHILFIVINLLLIIWETGSVNPYTYTGLNQKYYMSTGDFIRGITFDSPVTTAMIAAFGLLYFFYRRLFLFSILCMAALLIIVSNMTNLFLMAVFIFMFIFKSDRIQKSMLVIYSCMLVVFIIKVSPQNNRHIGMLTYRALDKNYFLPPEKVITNNELKTMPDSLLTYEQKRKKTGLLYIDSMSSSIGSDKERLVQRDPAASFKNNSLTGKNTNVFNEYKATITIQEKENRFKSFLAENYKRPERDSLTKLYDWTKPGKLIAIRELSNFFRDHTGKIWLGAGIGNFSSRVAFKATALDIAGGYPERFLYIHPYFHSAHLYLYLYYHSQWQINHTAANTPDSVYNQLLGEYGVTGFLLFIFLYAGYFFRYRRRLSYGLSLLLLILAAFSVEYWFEQLSVVILFDFLMLLDIRSMSREEQSI